MDRFRLRELANRYNGSTALGLAIARAGGARVSRGPRGLYYAEGYRLGFPVAGAFTVGNVILTRWTIADREAAIAGTLEHEEGHTWQYVYCLGLPFFPAYGLAMLWSYLRTGDRAAACFFEQEAGLDLGGYQRFPLIPLRVRAREVLTRSGRRRAASPSGSAGAGPGGDAAA